MESTYGSRKPSSLDAPERILRHLADHDGSMDCVDACIAAVQMAPGLGPLLNHELIPLKGSSRLGVYGSPGSNAVMGVLDR